ncbi:nuclear transport factor 2 family protein [Bizionia gelidisalsuginis]|uniref:Nuclear transport factor 2 family protein n=1 Tax=Bizionia gelidisalsuginis TaxID=291188 RepID=A0ABY3M785_9FLAO|nr:nuclear transport factor 2 family protein [Bizionia gelidisalsuginis]TYC08490.1 nuclear transport factor 2 family protein [Bizionia gelidisalsuginis]
MKKVVIVVMMLCTFISYAQKKNGTVYIEHPAIDVVHEFVKASLAGDKSKMASYLTDDFKAYNGTSNATNDMGRGKEAFIKNQMVYFNQLDYYAIEAYPGAYPDAIEYNKDNPNKEVWVQTWDVLKGVQKNTGVKIDAAAHRLYKLTKDHKINMIIGYGNDAVLLEIQSSFADRTNGTIYNHHDNINTIRKMMYAFEKKDFDKAYRFYDEEARFVDSSSPTYETITLTEQKKIDQQVFDKYEIISVDMMGYPDYLHYEMGDARVVQSWWNINLIRKSDKKEIILPIHYIHDFNEEGSVISETAYYNAKLLD